VTNQGGGGDAAGTSPTQVRTDSAADASFDERVEDLADEADLATHGACAIRLGSERWLAARCLRAEDALAAKDAEIARLKSEGVEDLIRQRDEARREAAARAKTITRMADDGAIGDAECSKHREDIARLTKERDDLLETASPNGRPAEKFMRLGERFEDAVLRLGADRDALKAALDEERKQAEPMVAACRSIAESFRSSIAFYNGLDVHVVSAQDAQRMIVVVDSFDARRSASRAKEGGK